MDLKNRDFLKEIDFTSDEFLHLVDLAIDLKAQKKQRREVQRMVGRNIALIFEKSSTRTRCAFEVVKGNCGAAAKRVNETGRPISASLPRPHRLAEFRPRARPE